jgi:hypothetical protein
MTSRAAPPRIQFRYCIVPGPVRSQFDGDTHHIGHRQLIVLYGLDDYRQDVLVRDFSKMKQDIMLAEVDRLSRLNYIFLYPRPAGDYMREREWQEDRMRRRIMEELTGEQNAETTQHMGDETGLCDASARQALPPTPREPAPGRYPGGRRWRQK